MGPRVGPAPKRAQLTSAVAALTARPSTVSSGPSFSAWATAADVVHTIAASPHAAAIAAIEDPVLKRSAQSLVTVKRTAERARADGFKASEDAVSDIDEAFRARPDDRHDAKAVLTREHRVTGRAHEAHTRLDAELTDFLTTMLGAYNSAQSHRRAEARAAQESLEQSETLRESDIHRLETARRETARVGLAKAGRLAMFLGATERRTRAEAEALIALLRASLTEAEEAWRGDVRRLSLRQEIAVRIKRRPYIPELGPKLLLAMADRPVCMDVRPALGSPTRTRWR